MGACGRRAARLLLFLAALAPSSRAGASSEALDHYHRGAALYSQGELEAALSEFRSALALDAGPHKGARVGMHFEDYDPQFQVGRIEARLGRFEEARKMLEACAASGYTERSENADEYRRWRAIVREASKPPVAASPAPVPPASASAVPGPATATATATSAAPPPPPAPTPARPAAELPPSSTPPKLPPAEAQKAVPREPPARGKEEIRVPEPASSGASVRSAPPSSSAGTAPNRPSGPAIRQLPPPPSPGLPWAWLAAAAAALLLSGFAALRARHGTSETAELSFGRYAIGDLLAAGRHSFIYGAADRKTGERVALKLRRFSKPAESSDRFEREAQALELVRRSPAESIAPRPIARGSVRKGSVAIEYLAFERLAGRTLIDFSRNARRKLDTLLCVDVLRAVVAAIARARELGLGHDELSPDDVFLLEPLPASAGNPVVIRLFGLTERRPDTDLEVRGVAAIASEVFRGRGASWEESDVLERVPAPLRQLLARMRGESGGPLPSLGELSAALESCRHP